MAESEDKQKQAQEAITEFLNKMTELKYPAFACALGDLHYLEAANLELPSKYLFSLTISFEAACATGTDSFEEAQEQLKHSDETGWKGLCKTVALIETSTDDPDSTEEPPDSTEKHLVSDPVDQPE